MTNDKIAAVRDLMKVLPIARIAAKVGVSRSTLYSHMDVIKAPVS